MWDWSLFERFFYFLNNLGPQICKDVAALSVLVCAAPVATLSVLLPVLTPVAVHGGWAHVGQASPGIR